MKGVVFLLVAIGVAAAFSELEEEWENWKTKYGKAYESDNEELRRSIWTLNREYVIKHNSELNSFTVEMNEFSDLATDEFVAIYNGYRPSLHNATRYYVPTLSLKDIPATIDWRDKGVVTGVKNQGRCGSCWAFSATGSLEGQHANKTGNLVSLSEQNLVDCVKEDDGCKGGLMVDAFKYIEKNKGIDTEASYPYRGKNEKCHFKESDIGATLTSYVQIKKEACSDLKVAVATIGPISAAMDASHNSFQLYKTGIYKPRVCSKTKLDHGVLVVGYGTEGGVDYWLMKNSWGKSWGMQGYFKIASQDDLCGICTAASYPVV